MLQIQSATASFGGIAPCMHIPDGFLTAPVAGAAYGISAIRLAYALRRTNRELAERQIPFRVIVAAFIFAAQILNFPVAGGILGHPIGAALAGLLLGPWAAVLVMTSVVAGTREEADQWPSSWD